MDLQSVLEKGKKIDAARRDPAKRCPVLRTDAKGRTEFHVEHPKRKRGPVKETLAYGAHAAGFLELDPATGEVVCACKLGKEIPHAETPAYSLEGKLDAIEAEAATKKG